VSKACGYVSNPCRIYLSLRRSSRSLSKSSPE